jgi:polyphosphate glucokinase
MKPITKPASTTVAQKILSIDIGGSNVKATLLNKEGKLQTEYKKLETPVPATPEKVMAAIGALAASLPGYDKISAGFPGYVKDNIVMTAPNLGTKYWKGYKLGNELTKSLGKPARVVNDADMQGLGIAAGKGFEIVVTLGTGFGTAFLYNGVLLHMNCTSPHPKTGTTMFILESPIQEGRK